MHRLIPLTLALAAALQAGQYKNFEVAVYARVYEVRQMKDLAWLQARWSVIEKALRVDKVYLETHRDMIVADEATLVQARKFFASRGIRTSGGITATVNERNLYQTLCYTNPAHREHLKKVVELTARVFDEVILDDFFFTNCKCDSCIRAKGDRSWTRFRLDLLEEASRNLVLGPARAVNPKVKVIIKYPNWYEHFQYLGYNLEAEPKLFDKVYTGTETRDAVYNAQHLQPYLGYALFRYLENIKPGGNAGGWVDPANRRTLDRYAEQLWITLFAKAPEVTLFDFRQLIEPIRQEDGTETPAALVARVAGYTFEQADGFLGKLGKPIGVKSYKPFHSSGEDFLHTYLGMLGIPIDLTPEFPAGAKMILLTESAKFDPGIVDKIKRQLLAGGQVFMTSGLLRALQGKGIEDIAELEYTDKKATAREFWRWLGVARSEAEITIPQIRYATNDVWETVSTLSRGIGYPLLLRASYGSGWLHVLAVPENSAELYQLPAEVLNQIRDVLTPELPVRIEGQSQVALYVYDNDTFIVESFLPHGTEVRIVADKRFAKLRDLLTGAELVGQPRGNRVVFEAPLRPSSYRVFSAN